jgi:hypothetical protein
VLEEENKCLKEEIRNSKVNLKINKEIIEGILNYRDNTDKNNFYSTKLKEENEKIIKQMEHLITDKEEIRNKVNHNNIACTNRTDLD